jgi:type III secretory pathway component EscS
MFILKCIRGAVVGAIGGILLFFGISVVAVFLSIFVGLFARSYQASKDFADAAITFAFLLVPVGIVIGLVGPINNERKRRQQAKEREESNREHRVIAS